MYFNNLPQGFGLSQAQQPQDYVDQPLVNDFTGGQPGLSGLSQYPFQQSPFQQAPQMQNFGNSGVGSRPLPPVSSAPKLIAGQAMAKGGVVGQTLGKSKVVSDGIAALRGQHPNPRGALDAYDREFGTDATAELMRAYADGGVVSGPGSGVADLVPGSIDGREDVRIASGEYVIPAWAVAALGDGSTEAGAKVLDAMVARLREEGSERIMGSEPINPNEFLPA